MKVRWTFTLVEEYLRMNANETMEEYANESALNIHVGKSHAWYLKKKTVEKRG